MTAWVGRRVWHVGEERLSWRLSRVFGLWPSTAVMLAVLMETPGLVPWETLSDDRSRNRARVVLMRLRRALPWLTLVTHPREGVELPAAERMSLEKRIADADRRPDGPANAVA